jgi:hypothetical protein
MCIKVVGFVFKWLYKFDRDVVHLVWYMCYYIVHLLHNSSLRVNYNSL